MYQTVENFPNKILGAESKERAYKTTHLGSLQFTLDGDITKRPFPA